MQPHQMPSSASVLLLSRLRRRRFCLPLSLPFARSKERLGYAPGACARSKPYGALTGPVRLRFWPSPLEKLEKPGSRRVTMLLSPSALRRSPYTAAVSYPRKGAANSLTDGNMATCVGTGHTIQGPAKKAKKAAATPKKTPQKKSSTVKSPPVSPRAAKPPKTPTAAPKTPKTPKTASKVQAIDYEETPRRSTRLRTPARP
jgi:hypothetical protein